MKVFIGFILLFLSNVVIAQTGSNPFEIKSRLDSSYNTTTTDNGSTGNIFDVEHSDVENRVVNESTMDTTKAENISDIVPVVVEDNMDAEDTELIQNSSNPFEVSHIPIRKSKLKEEADAFKPKEKVVYGKKTTKNSNVFLFWWNLLTALLIAVVINTRSKTIPRIYRSVLNENILKFNHREEGSGVNGHYLLLYIVFLLNLGIFIYLILYNLFDYSGQRVFWNCLGIVTAIYIVKHLALSILGTIFPFTKEVNLYNFTIESFNIATGIILIPINLIVAFGPENISNLVIYVGLGVIGIVLILRIFRGLFIALNFIQNYFFHFLLYLCTFEILPILIFLKIVGNFGK